jgi:ABC-type uncharacterized transport system fused permease/ATPase subunit
VLRRTALAIAACALTSSAAIAWGSTTTNRTLYGAKPASSSKNGAKSANGLTTSTTKGATVAKTGAKGVSNARAARVGVNAVFFRRLRRILQIILPGMMSKEATLLGVLTALLIGRTASSVAIARCVGRSAQYLVARQWDELGRSLARFVALTIPAAVINSGLKYASTMLALSWRERLSDKVHESYLKGMNFYKATALAGPDSIDHADQRVTQDISNFCSELAELYSTLFKPVMDVIVFTGSYARFMGWKSVAVMYGYFAATSYVKRELMPSFGRHVAVESQLEGVYRSAHNRLITHAEEIAFYNGAERESTIIHRALRDVTRHVRAVRGLKFLTGIFDNLVVKYWASITGYLAVVYSFVFIPENAALSTEELTRNYVLSSQFLGGLTSAIGELVLMGNKLTKIAGYTARVSELLEMVNELDRSGQKPFVIRTSGDEERDGDDDEASDTDGPAGATAPAFVPAVTLDESSELYQWLVQWGDRCAARHRPPRTSEAQVGVPGGGVYKFADDGGIYIADVDIVSPDGRLLVKDLSIDLPQGTNLMITGPNGVGKSSLFRVIGELWPLHCGVITKPRSRDALVFLPQKPYLVTGTLRDQIIYPHTKVEMEARGVTDDDLRMLLRVVDPAGVIAGTWTMDTVRDWRTAFSGGFQQRIQLTRLFYHCPTWAVADECSSAVSFETENTLYEACAILKINMCTISHRPALRRFHDLELTFLGGVDGQWVTKSIDKEEDHE